MQLTKDERVFIVTNYAITRSYRQVQNLFRLQFNQLHPPCKRTIWKNWRKYRQSGTSLNLNKGNSGRLITTRTQRNVRRVLNTVRENPRISCRRNTLGISKSSFNRIIRKNINWYPFKMHVRHQLLEGDFHRRRVFADFLVQKPPVFINNIVIGDEAAFALNGSVNRQNVRSYSPKGNPPAFNYEKSIRQEKLSVWVGMCGNGNLIGPFFYDNNLNGNTYLNMLNEQIIPEITRIYGCNSHRVWWFQDGAPAHRTRIVTQRLRDFFGARVVALSHAVEWPPRSPDLTPCDFFLWGYLKSRVYITPPRNLDDLRQRIINEINLLKENPDLIKKVMLQMRARAQQCLERNGGHVEGVDA